MKAFSSVETASGSLQEDFSWPTNILNISQSESCYSIEMTEDDQNEDVFDKIKDWF